VTHLTSLTSLPSRTKGFEHRIRKADPADLPALGYALSAAFHDDPVLSWIIPDEGRRRARLAPLMELFAGRFQPHGENHLNESGTGAAVWAPPGAGFSQQDDERFEAALVAAAGDDIARTARVIELLDANHPTGVPHWYLMLLGVTPERQGRGVGSALLRAVLDRADREGSPAYLEATSRRNRALYERHGFVTVGELTVADCPPLYAMWRPPA
jgi:GNAT superfamily N-acetyltransferase